MIPRDELRGGARLFRGQEDSIALSGTQELTASYDGNCEYCYNGACSTCAYDGTVDFRETYPLAASGAGGYASKYEKTTASGVVVEVTTEEYDAHGNGLRGTEFERG